MFSSWLHLNTTAAAALSLSILSRDWVSFMGESMKLDRDFREVLYHI